jgi:hypothetical protein
MEIHGRDDITNTTTWCNHQIDLILIFGVLTPLSTIFQLYHGDQS